MTKERKGEIALLIWKSYLKKKPISFTDLKRELGNVAKEIDVPLNELEEFARELFKELLEETFGKIKGNKRKKARLELCSLKGAP